MRFELDSTAQATAELYRTLLQQPTRKSQSPISRSTRNREHVLVASSTSRRTHTLLEYTVYVMALSGQRSVMPKHHRLRRSSSAHYDRSRCVATGALLQVRGNHNRKRFRARGGLRLALNPQPPASASHSRRCAKGEAAHVPLSVMTMRWSALLLRQLLMK